MLSYFEICSLSCLWIITLFSSGSVLFGIFFQGAFWSGIL